MNNNTLVGIITRNDQENYKKCISSIEDDTEIQPNTIVVNDGSHYSAQTYGRIDDFIEYNTPKHTSACVNHILRYAVKYALEHVFIVRDTVSIKDKNVYQKYISTSKETGLPILFHANKTIKNGKNEEQSNIRATINYTPDVGINLCYDTTTSFVYLNSKLVDEVGYLDERYRSVMEWTDYTQRIVDKGLLPSFGWFPDIVNSDNYINLNKSNDTLPDLHRRIYKGMLLFKAAYKVTPEEVPQSTLEMVQSSLKLIKNRNFVA